MLMPPGFAQRSLNTTLGRMVYYTAADAEVPDTLPPMVFLHGFGGGSSAYEWSKVFPAFAADYRVLAPDLIGWGRSAHPARSYRPEDYITTITEFLTATCPTPAIAVASSLTAAFVIRIAIARPELFRGLLLVAPSGLADFGENTGRNLFTQLVKTPIVDRLIYTFGIANANGIQSFLEQRQFAQADRVTPEMVTAYLQSAQQPNAEYAALSFVRGDLSFDLALDLPQLQVPTTILWGQAAQFTPVELGDRLVALNPTAIRALTVLEGVGLTPHLELPGVAIALLRRHLALI